MNFTTQELIETYTEPVTAMLKMPYDANKTVHILDIKQIHPNPRLYHILVFVPENDLRFQVHAMYSQYASTTYGIILANSTYHSHLLDAVENFKSRRF